MTTVESEVRTFLADNFALGRDLSQLSSTQSLTERGFIDSVGIVEVLTFLETTYDIQISDDETVPENIDTISNIVRFVETKRGATATAGRDSGA